MRALTLPFLRIGKISLYLAVFLTPLFFLPFGQSVLGYPKQILLLLLVFLGFGGWLAHQHIQGKIVLRTNKRLYIAALVLFSTFSLSVVFSAWPAASLWGFPLSANDSLLALFVFLLLAFLVAHALKSEGDLSLGVFFLISSGALAGIFTLLQLWNLFVLPFDFAKISSFNILGNVEQAALFLAALLPLALILAFRASKLIFWIIAFILFASLLLIDLRSAWFVFALGLFALIIFGAARGQNGVKAGRIFVLMSLLVMALFFLFFPLRPAIFPSLPPYVAPGTVAEFEILKGVWTEGVKGFLLGSGPGTFVFDYSKYRSPLLNLTTFWGTRFSSGSAEFLDWFVTKGFFGGLSLIGFLIVLIYEAIAGQRKAEHYSSLRLGFLASGAALIGAGLVAPFSFSLWFLFWLVVGGLLFYNSGLKEADLQKPAWRSVFSVVALLAAILLLGLFFLNLQKYAADLSYAKAVRFFQKGDIDGAIAALQKSTLLNSSADIYWRDLAQMYLLLTNSVVQDQGLSQERKNQLAQENIALGIQSLNQAVNRAKSNVANWNVRGFFYRSLIGIAGAQELALESYDRAIDLEPASPFAWGEKGRVYILMAQDFRDKQMATEEQESLELAIASLSKSIELKRDYIPARYLLAVAYDQQGKKEQAIARLEEMKVMLPRDVGIAFQLGMLYWRSEKLQQARAEFERILDQESEHSNALYMLGLVQDKQGDKAGAEARFEKVLQLNPENEEIKAILANIKRGLPPLEGIIPSLPPIEEMPLEIAPLQ